MTGEGKYTLRVPFQVQPGYALGSTGPSSRTSHGSMTVSLDQAPNGYALLVDGFPSSGAASEFTPRLWTGLTTLMLERGSAFSGSMDPQPVIYPEAPGRITAGLGKGFEGLADGDAPSIFPSHRKVGFLTAGRADLTITIPANQALASVLKGFQAEAAEQLFHDERVRTAVDLYSAALFERSPAARLLTLSMAFEVLAPTAPKHKVAQALISTWLASVESAKSANASDPAAVAALESLERELLFRREASIRGRIRDFVVRELGSDSRADNEARRVVSAYDSRSTLLHDGHLDGSLLAKAIEDFKAPLNEILLRRLGIAAA